jgi:archaellum component FlaC
MDQRESHSRIDVDDTRGAVAEKLEMIEDRLHETMEGTKVTIEGVMDNIKQVQMTVENVKSSVDNVLETVKYAVDETIERVKYTTDLIDQVNKNPWIMFGSAVLMGYVLSSINYEALSGSRQTYDQRKINTSSH